MSTLRDVHWTDIEQLAQLERELFADDAWSQQTWWAELAGRPRRDYVAEVEGAEVLGYAGLDHGGDVADVMTIAVAPSARGRGLGRRLLDELETRARAGRAASVMLEVRADNPVARTLYASLGFEEIGVRPRYYQPEGVDAVVNKLLMENRR